MSLLKLDNVGKIYVSEGNIAVGIRGVNLSFDRGELVAITGESGSGKSTLLNVISGMDTYEEGELFIEGQPTSHYLQPDWEQYRQKYISFIFQNYNIIDSFTVLQNVELALMNIKNPRERRARAVELIKRVGLSGHMKHKGSQLSGGQKQRTVIARALAKDSPIILADEPTGNLDSKTAQEIIELLREVSKDKLLIIVTHDFDLVENAATRHVRIFDGAVESDRILRTVETESQESEETGDGAENGETTAGEVTDETAFSVRSDISNGIRLGRALFTSKPRLSFFLCFLLIFGMAALFMITALCSSSTEMFRSFTLLQKTEGRLVVSRQDGQALADKELTDLAARYGAKDSLHYDYLLDVFSENSDLELKTWNSGIDIKYFFKVRYVYDVEYGTPDYGRYPEAADEVFLRLPYYYKPEDESKPYPMDRISVLGCSFKIVGVRYEVNTNHVPTVVLTKEGFKNATVAFGMQFLLRRCQINGEDLEFARGYVFVSNDVPADKIYCNNPMVMNALSGQGTLEFRIDGSGFFSRECKDVSGTNPNLIKVYETTRTFRNEDLTTEFSGEFPSYYRMYVNKDDYLVICMGTEIARTMFEGCLEGIYGQGSLFFESDKEAKKAADEMRDEGYFAITTDETYAPDDYELVNLIMEGIGLGILWIITIILIVFVINLCTNRSMEAFREDMAIMRSMGIPVRVIKIGMYVRMLFALIPALLLIPVMRYLVYHNRSLSLELNYLEPIHYVILVIGLIFLTMRITRKQVRHLFSASVKTSLRGGDAL